MIVEKFYPFGGLDELMEEVIWMESKFGIFKERNPHSRLLKIHKILLGEKDFIIYLCILTDDDTSRYNEINSRKVQCPFDDSGADS